MYQVEKIYKSWLKRTKHITEDCDYCGNARYTLKPSYVTDRTREYYFTLNACPVCNFGDLQITQNVSADFPNLSDFVELKKQIKL